MTKAVAVKAQDLAPRQPHEPDRYTRKFVRRMVVAGFTQAEVAEQMGITPSALTHHYPVELKAHQVAVQRVSQVLYQKALRGDITAGIFWLKARAGWRDRDAAQIAVQANVHAPSRDQIEDEATLIGKIEQLRPMAVKKTPDGVVEGIVVPRETKESDDGE